MKRLFILFFLLIFILGLYVFSHNKSVIYSYLINVSGEIKINKKFSRLIKPNYTLYIILKNDKDLIVSAKQIINPKIPLKFSIKPKDILYPEILTYKLKIYATVNKHGKINTLERNDLYSEETDINIFSKNIKILIDYKKY